MYPTFFLSHSSKDVRLVTEFMNLLRLGMNLREEDIFCTSSQDAIKIGEPYIDVIRDNFNGSKIIIMLISRNYLESKFCISELGATWASDKIMLPILVNVSYKAIEYPSTPLKPRQVGELKSKETLTAIYDYLKDNGAITAKTNSFNSQLESFMKKRLWENPAGDRLLGTNQGLSKTESPLTKLPIKQTSLFPLPAHNAKTQKPSLSSIMRDYPPK